MNNWVKSFGLGVNFKHILKMVLNLDIVIVLWIIFVWKDVIAMWMCFCVLVGCLLSLRFRGVCVFCFCVRVWIFWEWELFGWIWSVKWWGAIIDIWLCGVKILKVYDCLWLFLFFVFFSLVFYFGEWWCCLLNRLVMLLRCGMWDVGCGCVLSDLISSIEPDLPNCLGILIWLLSGSGYRR